MKYVVVEANEDVNENGLDEYMYCVPKSIYWCQLNSCRYSTVFMRVGIHCLVTIEYYTPVNGDQKTRNRKFVFLENYTAC